MTKPRRGGVAVLVSDIDAPGGMERQAARLAERFVRRGRPVVVITNFFPAKRGIRLFGRHKLPRLVERRDGLVIYRLPYWSSLWFNYPTSQELFETLGAWILHRHAGSIDTIYAVQAQSGGVHAAKIAWALARPTVLKLACSGEAGDLEMSRHEPNAGQVFECLRRLDRVVYLNEESRAEALAAGVEPERLVHIPNGIDLERFDREAAVPARLEGLGPEEARELVVFVGRLDHQKRVAVLIEAFARLAPLRPRARLALVGDGPAREELERRARELGLEGRAVFTGVRKDVPAILRAASVFTLPSAQEGLSNALLEALAAGAPAVASDIPGNRSVARHEREALLVPVDDAPALARAIERLLDDRELAARLARAGRARVEEEFTLDGVAGRYLELFDALPRGHAPSLPRFWIRYTLSDLTGLTHLLLRGLVRDAVIFLGFTRGFARAAITAVVVRAKKALGIERDILPLVAARAGERRS